MEEEESIEDEDLKQVLDSNCERAIIGLERQIPKGHKCNKKIQSIHSFE
jgi:hypothetical protein